MLAMNATTQAEQKSIEERHRHVEIATTVTTDENSNASISPAPYWNPYLCGVLLGLVLIASYVTLGTGLGASATPARLVAQIELWLAPEHTKATEYFAGWGERPLAYYLVYMTIGTFLGGLISAVAGRRVRMGVEKGKACSNRSRLLLVFGGGLLAGFASRLARGCTSGQALSGGALLLNGSLVFMACLFLAGYATAFMFRRQWHD